MNPGSCLSVGDKLYALVNGDLYEIDEGFVYTKRGRIAGGDVSMAVNNTQLAIVAGQTLYAFDLTSKILTTVSTEAGTIGVCNADGYGALVDPDTNTFRLTGLQDFTAIDPLDYVADDSIQGNIVAHMVKHREILLLGRSNGTVWYDSGDSDFPFARNDGAAIEVGCAARATLQKLNGSAYWLGRDNEGTAIVFGMAAYSPTRVSSHALEERLSTIADLSGAYAWTYHQEGQSFYVLNVPGLDTTWVYEVSAGIWHERTEYVDGRYRPWRAVCHAIHAGKHVVFDADGGCYEIDPLTNSYGGAPIVRDIITPHTSSEGMEVQRFGSLQVDCDVGYPKETLEAGAMMLRYSNDGGRNWCNWQYMSLGAVGETRTRARATMLGAARDRVWQIRVTDDVRCNVLAALVNER